MQSRAPKREIASCTMASTCSRRVTSAVKGRAAEPISAATFSAAPPFMSATSPFAPSAAKRRHIAAPKPEPPPVTMIDLSLRRIGACPPEPGSAVELHEGLGGAHLFEREKTLLAPVPTFLHTAEGQFHAPASPIGVDEHLPAVHGLGDALLAPAVLGPDGGH